ncbi:MAG: peptidoglycan editing factor PgeF [Betaproteobacteria bacterium]
MADAALATALAARALDWIVPRWDAPARVHALMTTRNGGASCGNEASLDVGGAHFQRDAADPLAVAENRRRIETLLPTAPVWLEQVHGRGVIAIDAANVDLLRASPPRADALVTRCNDVVLAIRVADCVPVLFAARDADPVIGAAHAGWRGLAGGVLEATLAAMAAPPASVVAWVGPAIGANAFEVGHDVVDAFCAGDPGAHAHFVARTGGKFLADLHALARRRLRRAGVVDVHADDSCTFADAARFFSFRRDGATGRMAALIWQAGP